jgi:hypothetical protein
MRSNASTPDDDDECRAELCQALIFEKDSISG